jgi:hypothetical protein
LLHLVQRVVVNGFGDDAQSITKAFRS